MASPACQTPGCASLDERCAERVQSLQAERQRRRDEAAQDRCDDEALAGTPALGQPGDGKGAADAEKQADVEKDLADPDCRPQTPVDSFGDGRRRTRRADRKQHRAADRMAIGGDHPPAQHMRAGSEPLRIVDVERLAIEPKRRQRNRRSIRPHQAQHQR